MHRTPSHLAYDEPESCTTATRHVMWSLKSAEVFRIECPTCGAARHSPCRTLRDRPTTTLHRGRTSRYLNLRFGLNIAEPHARTPEFRPGPRAGSIGLNVTRTPHHQPWRLPLHELSELVNVSFLDLARVVTAHACGLRRTGLDNLLFGPDRIQQSIDALIYAQHDRQIRREIRVLAGGQDEQTAALAEQRQAVRERLHEAQRSLKQRRLAELTAAGVLPFPAPTNDPRQLARAWLGRYLSDEKEALVRDIATTVGISPAAAVPIRSIREKISKAIDNGWLAAPFNDGVRQVLELDDHAFRLRLIADAARQEGRDDALCHPLVLNRWRDQLNEVISDMAPSAENPSVKRLHDLSTTGRTRSTDQLERLHGRRRLFASLLQRREESTRLITELNDTLMLAERRDPSYLQLKVAADHAYDELVRRYPDLYRHIRASLAPHETRYGRLVVHGSRSEIRLRIFAELDRLHSGQPPQSARRWQLHLEKSVSSDETLPRSMSTTHPSGQRTARSQEQPSFPLREMGRHAGAEKGATS
ncbi:zinc finger domain-containing protein [Streptomyces pristinaespiralis]|uniref:zinc finger domain-containing protein n=1 Tax=Streptomyces pristinaespiralis TaxID=38300 RepID=UPI0034089CD4